MQFHDALGELHSLVLEVVAIEAFLEDVTGLAAEAVQPGVSCGITTRYDSSPVTFAASDERASLLAEAQHAHGAGPCLEALSTGQVVDVPDQATERRWGAYGEAALDLGLKCSLSLPIFVDRSAVGALTLYGFSAPSEFSGPARLRAEVFAGQASTALTLALRFNDQAERSRHLVEALQSRSVIDQALGILMVEQKCDARAAFDLLRQRSQSVNLKLRQVAADVVVRASGHPLSSPSPFEDSTYPGVG